MAKKPTRGQQPAQQDSGETKHVVPSHEQPRRDRDSVALRDKEEMGRPVRGAVDPRSAPPKR